MLIHVCLQYEPMRRKKPVLWHHPFCFFLVTVDFVFQYMVQAGRQDTPKVTMWWEEHVLLPKVPSESV